MTEWYDRNPRYVDMSELRSGLNAAASQLECAEDDMGELLTDVINATEAVSELFRKIGEQQEALADVWFRLDRWRSGDSGKEGFVAALAKWRETAGSDPTLTTYDSIGEAEKRLMAILRPHIGRLFREELARLG